MAPCGNLRAPGVAAVPVPPVDVEALAVHTCVWAQSGINHRSFTTTPFFIPLHLFATRPRPRTERTGLAERSTRTRPRTLRSASGALVTRRRRCGYCRCATRALAPAARRALRPPPPALCSPPGCSHATFTSAVLLPVSIGDVVRTATLNRRATTTGTTTARRRRQRPRWRRTTSGNLHILAFSVVYFSLRTSPKLARTFWALVHGTASKTVEPELRR